MQRDHEISSRPSPTVNRKSASWKYPNANEYDELGVQELLHGLEAESRAATNLSPSATTTRSNDQLDADPVEVCHSCQRKNPAGQRFCGYCGTKLAQGEAAIQDKAREAWPFTPAPRSSLNVRVADVTQESWSSREGDEAVATRDSEPESEPDLQFLRDVAANNADEGSSRGWKALLLAIVLLGGGYAGYRWLYGPPTPPPAMYKPEPAEPATADESQGAPATTQPAASSPAQGQPQATTQSATGTPAQNAAGGEVKSAPKSAQDDAQIPAGEARSTQTPLTQTPSTRAPLAQAPLAQETAPAGTPAHLAVLSGDNEKSETVAPQAAPAPATADGGQQELATAERYLNAPGGQRDSREAAKWLWQAVGKQNGRAILLLSELYAKGDGVSRNCDQARLLLMTAVKKKVPAAGQELSVLESAGCQ